MADQGKVPFPGPTATVCLDFQGRELWSAGDFTPKAALPGGSLIGVDTAGRVCILDAAGQPRPLPRYISGLQVRKITLAGAHLHLETEAELLVTDHELTITGRIAIPPMERREFGAFTGDGFVWVQSDTLMISDAAGAARVLCDVLVELAEEAMDRFEDETGEGALGGWLKADVSASEFEKDPSLLVDAILDPGRQTRLGRGERPLEYIWEPCVDHENGLVFVTNLRAPHLLACIGLDGAPRWCLYLSSGCCGGLPAALPNGSYVVSSGCGGILSWFTAAGYVLHRTDPPAATDLSGAFSNQFHVLPDSSFVVPRGYDVVAYGPDARPRWSVPHAGSDFAYCERRGVLFTSAWTSDHDGTQCIEVRAFADLLPAA